MSAPAAEPVAAQLVSERGRWYVPVPWDQGDDLRLALARQGFPSTLCLNPETREARLELWPNVSPPEFLAALEQLRGNAAPPLARPAAGGAPADQASEKVPAVQRT
jgi:hypothetical protein